MDGYFLFVFFLLLLIVGTDDSRISADIVQCVLWQGLGPDMGTFCCPVGVWSLGILDH